MLGILNKHKYKIIATVVVIILLCAAWTVGGGYAKDGSDESSSIQTSNHRSNTDNTANGSNVVNTGSAVNDGTGVESSPFGSNASNLSSVPGQEAPDTEGTSSDAGSSGAPVNQQSVEQENGNTTRETATPLPSPGETVSTQGAQALQGTLDSDSEMQETDSSVPEDAQAATSAPTNTTPEGTTVPADDASDKAISDAGKDAYNTNPVSDGKPAPVEPLLAQISNRELSCTISVRCDTILNNMGYLNSEKYELVPEDGCILKPVTVTFYEGESVFNVLQREMRRAKIHLEFSNVPIYNSVYIEGINNLYEFDVGELSGWMYKVNDWFPNYGCSRYQLKDDDVIEWVYTCDLGEDVGGGYAVGNR